MSEETVTFNLELNVEQAFSQVRRLETLLFRCLGLVRRLGLPDDINQAIYVIQRWVMAIRLAHSAYVAFYTAAGPIGWGFAIVGGVSAVMTMGELMMETS